MGERLGCETQGVAFRNKHGVICLSGAMSIPCLLGPAPSCIATTPVHFASRPETPAQEEDDVVSRALAYAVEPVWRLVMRDLGVDEAAVLGRARLPADALSHGPSSLPADAYFRFWETLAEGVQDPDFPLSVNTVLRTEAFSPPLFAALCSPDLLTAVQRISRYREIVTPMRVAVETTDDELSLTLSWLDAPGAPPAPLAAAEFAYFVHLARSATREHIRPLRVESPTHLEPQDACAEFFGAPIVRGPEHIVRFSARDANRPFVATNDSQWLAFAPPLRTRLAALGSGASVAARTRAALLEGLPSARAAADASAKLLGMSKRTLQRKLKHEHTSFNEVLRTTREALARHYLNRTVIRSPEIAFLLGFEDPNSFYRAFSKWTGTTPEAFRNDHA